MQDLLFVGFQMVLEIGSTKGMKVLVGLAYLLKFLQGVNSVAPQEIFPL